MSKPNQRGGRRQDAREAHDEMLRERQTARGLVTHAKEFWRAAELIAGQAGTDDWDRLKDTEYHHPFYYLCGHSLELSMKASLLSAGRSHEYLKRLGHDLTRCLDAMRRHYPDRGTTYDDCLPVIEVLNRSYAAKEFEYRVTGCKSWPHVSDLLCIVEDFYLLVRGIVDEAEGRSG